MHVRFIASALHIRYVLQLLMLQVTDILNIESLHFTPRTPLPTVRRLVSQMECVVPSRCAGHNQAGLPTARILGSRGMHSPNFCVATLRSGGLLNPSHALVTYLVPCGGGDGVPPQYDLAQIFLPLDQISLRPLPVLLDAGLVDGELWSFVAGDGTGARGQGKCKEKEYAVIHHDYCW